MIISFAIVLLETYNNKQKDTRIVADAVVRSGYTRSARRAQIGLSKMWEFEVLMRPASPSPGLALVCRVPGYAETITIREVYAETP